LAAISDLQTTRIRGIGTNGTNLDKEFELRAKRVFAQFSDPSSRAMEDAKMMWLAWRGDERFVQVHLSGQPGFESSWRFSDYAEIDDLVERFKHVEVRPVHSPFADHVLAHLTILMQRRVAGQSGARIYTLPTIASAQGISEKEAVIEDAYKYAKEGLEVVADWLKEPNGFLKSKSISLTSDHFLYTDFVNPKGRGRSSARGFMFMLSAKERASARRRKRSLIKWILYD